MSVKEIPEGCKLSERKYKIKDAGNNLFEVFITERVKIKGNFREGYADLLYVAALESNLLGQDLQVQLNIGVVPEGGRMVAKIMTLKEKVEKGIDPRVWAEEGGHGLLNIPPCPSLGDRYCQGKKTRSFS